MKEFLDVILTNTAVQTALVAIIVAAIGWAGKKHQWLKTIALFATVAYDFAQKQGVIQGLKGYEKFGPFMDKLNEQIQEKFGRDATPEERGQAVKVMEDLVTKEPKKSSEA